MMNQTIRLLLVALVIALTHQPCHAQWFRGGGYGGVGTAYSAEQHGIADMVRSEGEYNYLTTAGMINYEEARGKYIENSRQYLEFYQYKKRYLEGERAKEVEAARESRARYVEYRAANPDMAPRLSTSQLSLVTGEIKWPSALKRDTFFTLRQEMEALFTSKALNGTTSEISQGIYLKTKEIQAELRKHIREIVTYEFIQARKFLESLATEGTVPRE